MPKFTPTEENILDLLSDGQRHRTIELVSRLDDDMARPKAVRNHVARLREKLSPIGEHILCEFYRGAYYYRHVRLLQKSE